MPMLEGKVAIVTGAGGGIGREIALAMALAGAKVVVNDIGASLTGIGETSATPGEGTKAIIEQRGGTAVTNTDSVADWESARRIVATALDAFGRLDIVVNNAGILRDQIFHKMTPEEWRAVIDVHLNGGFYVSRAAAEPFRAQGSGAYVHMTSTSGLVGNFGQANYAAAKAGIQGFTKTLAIELGRFGITVNAVAPGFVETEMTRAVATKMGMDFEDFVAERAKLIPVGRSGKPEDIAASILFFASEEAGFVSGQVLYAAGGPRT